MQGLESFDGSMPMTGVGTDVFHYRGPANAVTFVHDGSSNIASFGMDRTETF